MISLILAIVSSMMITVFMRLSENRRDNPHAMLAVNYVTCCIASWLTAGMPALFPDHSGLPLTIGMGVVAGFLFLAGFVLLQWNLKHNGVVLPATFQKLGVVVPTLMAILFFDEAPRLWQMIGIGLTIAAIVLMQGKGDKGAGSLAGLIALLLSGGLADGMSKIYSQFGAPELSDHYLLYTFFVALVLCAALCMKRGERLTLRDVMWGVAVGVPNYFSALFLLDAMSTVPAVVAYPTFSVGTILLVAAVSAVIFHERLSRRKLMCLGLILVALVLLNI
ncbi:MAG: DMT family transporter [Clostridia bacterium]|nr:DMT family transporter [Clostridia bacterium]